MLIVVIMLFIVKMYMSFSVNDIWRFELVMKKLCKDVMIYYNLVEKLWCCIFVFVEIIN